MSLGANGKADVELPKWFEALNRDFRYQLTAIGDPAPNLHISREMIGNRFEIAGGAPGISACAMSSTSDQSGMTNGMPAGVTMTSSTPSSANAPNRDMQTSGGPVSVPSAKGSPPGNL